MHSIKPTHTAQKTAPAPESSTPPAYAENQTPSHSGNTDSAYTQSSSHYPHEAQPPHAAYADHQETGNAPTPIANSLPYAVPGDALPLPTYESRDRNPPHHKTAQSDPPSPNTPRNTQTAHHQNSRSTSTHGDPLPACPN